jgi:hypothetical protein
MAVLEEKVRLYEKALSMTDWKRIDYHFHLLENQHDESYKVETLQKKCVRLQSIIDRMEVGAMNQMFFSCKSTSF